jgi:hypothetical protein
MNTPSKKIEAAVSLTMRRELLRAGATGFLTLPIAALAASAASAGDPG